MDFFCYLMDILTKLVANTFGYANTQDTTQGRL